MCIWSVHDLRGETWSRNHYCDGPWSVWSDPPSTAGCWSVGLVQLGASHATAWLITRTGRWEHITLVLWELHWLPVRQRIDFKLAVLVHKALQDQLPQYLSEDCQLLTEICRWSLRSADVLTCATKRTRTRLGDRSFSVARPCLWNSLLSHYVTEIFHLYSLRDFWRHFGLCRAAAHSDCCFYCAVYKYSYLLTYLLAAAVV